MAAVWPLLAVLCVLVLLRAAEIEAACNKGDKFVENVFPNRVSMAGGVRITIQGCGFEGNQYDNPNNAVYLVTDLGETIETEKHIDKNTESQMTVYTPSGLDPDKVYHLRLTLGGETWDENVMCNLHPERCDVSVSWDITPTIESMTAYSGPVGTLVQLYGKIFTTRYGTNIEVSDNDCNYRILRVWFGGRVCELKNSTTKDDFYGLQLDNSTTDYGIMVCKPKRQAPGDVQINFVLEDQYGSSMAVGTLQRASRDQGVHIYEAFAEVSGISPRRCGPGCLLKVYGSFDSEENGYSEVLVFVGGQPCKVVEVVPGEYLTCEVPMLTADLLDFAGGRGQITSLFSGQTGPTDDEMRTLAVDVAPDKTVLTDEAHFCNDDVTMDRMVMTFFFVASVSGPYSFSLKATTSGTLFLNDIEVATSSGGVWGDSATTFDIVADEWTKIDAVAAAVTDGETEACITVRSVQYNTLVPNTMSDLSTPEWQRIELTSDVQYQRWSLEFKNFASSTSTPEIQTVSVKNDGQIQLTLFGVSTVPIEFDDDAREYTETALNQLPFLGDGENFSVGPVSAGSFDITFNSGRGDIPNFTCGGPVCTVTEYQKGEPDNGKLSFLMNGTPSPVISYTDNTTEFTPRLKIALETMFSAVCLDMFQDVNASFTDSFETMSSPQAATDIPAFCGRKSRKNPWMFFSGKKNLRTPTNKWMCFAVNGLDNNNILVKSTRARPSTSGGYESEVRYKWYTFDTIPAEGSGSPGWKYTCINLQAKIKNSNTGWDNFELEGAYLRQNDGTIDFYVDAVQLIGDTQLVAQLFQHQLASNGTLNNLRLGPARANVDEVFTIDAVDVQLDATAAEDVYLVELRPNDCGNNFQPIKLSDEGGSASLVVQELSRAQPPISGSYTLRFKDKLITIDGNISDANLTLLLKDKLNEQLGGDVSVERSRASTCANMFINVKMIGVGGDQPMMEVISSALQPASASVSVVPVTDGKYTHDPVSGTYSRTSFKKPQVQVFINGVMSRCGLEHHDCFLDYDSSILPIVNSISPAVGAPLSTVTITGNGLNVVPEKNKAYIGDTECEILTASETQLTCKVGYGKAGSAAVKVKVADKGNSTGSVTFTNQAVVTTFSPTESGIGGGIIMTMDGSGFSENIEVLVGRHPCIIEEVLPDQVTCEIPLYEDAVQGEGDYTVDVAVYANAGDENPTASPGQFTYRWDCTPVVDAVIISEELTVEGGQLVTVQGSGLGTNEVFVAGKEAVVLRHTDTEIEFETPPGLEPETSSPIDIWVGGRGSGCKAVQFKAAVKRRKRNSGKRAKKPELPDVQLAWSGMSPTSGSRQGGTRLTIAGKGFGKNTNNVKVTVGTTDCKVEKSTRTAIECKLDSTVKTYEVNNWDMGGKDTYLGFSQSTITICLGDIVHWQWTLQAWQTGVSLTLVQVECSNPMKPIEGGIREPGNQARHGDFKHQFVKTGTYCFANGPYDKYKRMSSSMEVNVKNCTAEEVDVKVEVNGKTAKFKKGGSVTGSCTSTGALTSCSTTPAEDGKYVFDPCLTPSGLTPPGIEMSFRHPFPDDFPYYMAYDEELKFTGKDFDASGCKPTANIGTCSCIYKSHSSTEFVCTPSCLTDTGPLPDTGSLLDVTFELQPFGFGFMQRSKLGILPVLDSIYPTSGSTQGGTSVTLDIRDIKATDGEFHMTVGNNEAIVKSKDPWIFEVPAGTAEADVAVTIVNSNGNFPVPCRADPCTFTYDTGKTPTIQGASLSGITVTFNGNNFQPGMSMEIGGETCTEKAFIDATEVSCTLGALPATSNIVMKSDSGYAFVNSEISNFVDVTGLDPNEGSIYGGTLLTFLGSGFIGETTIVATDGSVCDLDIDSSNPEKLVCRTSAHATGSDYFNVTSNGKTATRSLPFAFNEANTPTITGLSPTVGSKDTVLEITATTLGPISEPVKVRFDDDPNGCSVSSIDHDNGIIMCTVEEHPNAVYKVSLDTVLGYSNNKEFDYIFTVEPGTPISKESGPEEGGQSIVIAGYGFTEELFVSIGGEECRKVAVSSTTYECITPPGSGTQDVVMSEDSNNKLPVGSYGYKPDIGIEVTKVEPSRGGTGGGNNIVITGKRFSGSSISVTIDGSNCDVKQSTDTEIQCTTSAHSGTITAPVVVEIDDKRSIPGGATFQYADLWSAPETWGGKGVPLEGDLVVIGPGHEVVFDTVTPVLEFLIINGGKLSFEDKDGVALHSKGVLITGGGTFEIGTEDNPFTHDTTVALYGSFSSVELPIYGTKMIAVRNGTLDMHGKEVNATWTLLAQTANKGDTQIKLQEAVCDWPVGGDIVIATTGESDSAHETEVRTIQEISDDCLTVTLTQPLSYMHLSVIDTVTNTETGTTHKLPVEAEVGLLSRNIKVVGIPDLTTKEQRDCSTKIDEFPASCTGLGADEFGAQIIAHPPAEQTADDQIVKVRIAYVELTYMGQAFRLGRYPIHFHIVGVASDSYVIGVAINKSFNRAVNLHATHFVLIKKVVAYNIMGGAYFLEDGIETGIMLIKNIAVLVKSSTSLLNDDITPACFWITTPNNIVIECHCVASVFGFWSRFLKHSEGPSFSTEICPNKGKMGEFSNNVAHSLSRMGLWIFPEYFPKTDGSCWGEPEVAVFKDFTAYRCEKCAEFVDAGDVQFRNFTLFFCDVSAFDAKRIMQSCGKAMLVDSVLVGYSDNPLLQNKAGQTEIAVQLPFGSGFSLIRVAIFKFRVGLRGTTIKCICTQLCNGFSVTIEHLYSFETDYLVRLRWASEMAIIDKTGSLVGEPRVLVPGPEASVPDECTLATRPDGIAVYDPDPEYLAAWSCRIDMTVFRFALSKAQPESLLGKEMIIDHITSLVTKRVPFTLKQIGEHKPGWMWHSFDVENNNAIEDKQQLETILLKWDFGEPVKFTNVSFSATITHINTKNTGGDIFIVIAFDVASLPDVVSVDGGTTRRKKKETSFTVDTAANLPIGAWFYEDERLFILIKKAMDSETCLENSVDIDVTVYKCYFKDCEVPLPRGLEPILEERYDPTQQFHGQHWGFSEDGIVETKEEGGVSIATILQNGHDVTIHEKHADNSPWWILFTKDSIPSLKRIGILRVFGVFEIDYLTITEDVSLTLEAEFIIIYGRLIIGWPDPERYFTGHLNIVLASLAAYPQSHGAPVGEHALVVYGGLDIHGPDVTSWTTLSKTAIQGENTVQVEEDVSSWKQGDQVIITSTSYDHEETEVMTIDAVNGKFVSFTATLLYKHAVVEVGDKILAARLALLTRRIKVMGTDGHYARVLVTQTTYRYKDAIADDLYTGFARINNVEFYKVAQWGYTDQGDPRCGFTILNTGPTPTNRPVTSVRSCAFHDLTNSGICIFNAEDVHVEMSTIYGAVGRAIWTESVNTNLVGNVVSVCSFPGAYQGRRETFNNDWPGCIESLTSYVYMQNNFVHGGERAGYRTCQPCDESQWQNNFAVVNVLGYAVLPTDPPTCGNCHRINGFTFFMNINMGIYHQYTGSLVVEYNFFGDNPMGVMPIIIGGDAGDHVRTRDEVIVKDNTFVGDATGECPLPGLDGKTYIQLAGKTDPPLPTLDGGTIKISLVLPTCTSATNKAPIKPFTNIMKYPSLECSMTIKDNTVKNMDGKCAVFLSLNKNQDDANFPVSSSNMIWGDNVTEKGKQCWPSSNLGKMNKDDCVDMVCDAMRTWGLNDLDGSFTGTIGAVIPLDEWGTTTGLIDDKIPKTVTSSVHAPNRGIKSKDCIRISGSIHGYFVCEGSYVTQVALESLDADTLTRRIGPVAFIVEDYIYLANGPQDHGYCHGYTCHERLSFFLMPILMPFDENSQASKDTIAEVHLSSDNPKETRLFIIGARKSDCVIIRVYYAKPSRVDVLVDGEYKRPTNAEEAGDKLTYKLDSYDDLVPSCIAGATHGTNYVDRNSKFLIVALVDTQSVTLQQVDQIMMMFNWPSVSTKEFFTAENLVRNIANLLGVDASKVRVVDVVAVTDNRRRRKRDTQTQYQSTIEIGPQPTGLQGEPENLATQASQLMNDCQSGAIEQLVGIPGTTCGQMVYEKVTYTPAIPASLGFRQTAVPQNEGVPFSTQPKLRAYDSDGNAIAHLGTVEYPWQMTAVLRNGTGHSRAVLSGTLTIQSVNGWFNFTDLAISHAGTGYIIDFYISSPSGHENMTIASDALGVTGRPLTAGVYSMTSGHIPQNSVFTLTFNLRDETTGEVIQDITWRDHEFDVTCNLTVAMDTWTLGGSLSQTFDSDSGRATFGDLAFSGYGLLYIGCKIESTPAEYEFYSYHEAVVLTPGQQALTIDATNIVTLRFNVDYTTYLASKMAEYQLLQAITYKLGIAYSDVIISAAALSEGSIIVTLTIEGHSVNMTSMTQLLCSDISDGSTVTVGGAKLTFDAYMMVDGTDYYSTCASDHDDDDKSLHPGFIALIAVCAALVIGMAVAAFLLWWFKIHKKAKIHGVRKWNVTEANDNGRTVFLAGPSHKMEKALAQQQDAYRPGSAAPLSTLYDDGGLPVRRSPHPAFRAEPSLHTDRSMTPTD